MPLNEKGSEIMRSMKEQYGPEKGERVFYASKNAGRIKGVDRNKDGIVAPTEAELKPEIGNLIGEESRPEATPRGKTSADQSSEMVLPVSGGAPMNNLGKGIPAPVNISSQPAVPSASTTLPASTGDSLRSMNAANRAFWAARKR